MLARPLAALALLAVPATAASYRFRAVWDGERTRENVCVTTRGDRIESVGDCPADAIDLSRYTAIPGMIDAHTHLTYVKPNPVSPVARNAAVVYLSAANARKTLEAGIGGPGPRRAELCGHGDAGPDQQGTHAWPAHVRFGIRIAGAARGHCHAGTATGAAEVMRVVRQQVFAGADVIKMYGSTGSGADVTHSRRSPTEEMKAAVDAAHALGKRIAIHSYGPDGARDAVRAGTDTLEHATDMDDATIAEMARRKTWYVPTIDHNRYYADNTSPRLPGKLGQTG